MKNGKLKRILLDRTLVERNPWIALLAVLACYLLLFGIHEYVKR